MTMTDGRLLPRRRRPPRAREAATSTTPRRRCPLTRQRLSCDRSGFAPGMAGYVNITQHRGGKVTFIVDDAADSVKPVTFVKQIESHRYDYSVLQVSSVLSSPEAEAPVAPPAPVNLTELLSKKYCKSFAGLLAADAKAFDIINGTKDTALTLFCPVDAAVDAFMPKFKNLTAKAKTAILLYHAVPDYYSMQFLKSNKGKVNTLATTSVAKKDYTYEAQTEADTVTLDTTVTTSTVQATVRDDDPLAIYAISKFLQPKELFKSKKSEDLAPAPAPEGPKKKKTRKKPGSTSAAEAPSDDEAADGPAADASADDAADKAGAAPSLLARWVTAVATATAAMALAA
ncbi:unnamed protein product [Urochloa decumbens]|uniref:FAS1 domain-containing protein n=1 Tax=Urochloa decumbens TaxID=240449 RepID=A0ABC9BS32_9POAL